MKDANTASAIEARRKTTAALIQRVEKTLREMAKDKSDLTIASIARRADVSRTFLYQNAEARSLVARYVAEAQETQLAARRIQSDAEQSSWRERALNAEQGLSDANDEIRRQRRTISDLLGKLRDLEAELPEESAQQLLAQNNSLKGQIRDLKEGAKLLRDRLEAARDNNLHLDRRLAALEAELDPAPSVIAKQRLPPTRGQARQ
ncbi:MAG: hypothetical protein K1X67_02205 [Fimbriimonadaceae bacterium]|nr:hypothetical protein [Fimbriimonadaceae bacterium]